MDHSDVARYKKLKNKDSEKWIKGSLVADHGGAIHGSGQFAANNYRIRTH